eukprot:1072144-Ditylum_brightwellii.AAC.1
MQEQELQEMHKLWEMEQEHKVNKQGFEDVAYQIDQSQDEGVLQGWVAECEDVLEEQKSSWVLG